MVVAKTVVVTLRGTGERTGVGEGEELKEVGEGEGEGLEVGEVEGLEEVGEEDGEDVGI